jgi:hypothetical protein
MPFSEGPRNCVGQVSCRLPELYRSSNIVCGRSCKLLSQLPLLPSRAAALSCAVSCTAVLVAACQLSVIVLQTHIVQPVLH